ncbi:MAG: COQ9 family protein [Acetobacteraceae bacterium]|nr:COQ9 family protein [Acetobacteraceae bacterium]
MITPPERSPERDAALSATLPHVPFDGWTRLALRRGLVDIAVPAVEAELLFPGGARDLIEAFCDLADRSMEAAAAARNWGDTRLTGRVRGIIVMRLEQNRPHKEAIRRAVAILALPGNAQLAFVCTARTVDAIWHAAGDRATDFSWYTKRAILAAAYTTTLLFWLDDSSEEDTATLAFLDRRLADVGRIGKVRRRLEGVLGR